MGRAGGQPAGRGPGRHLPAPDGDRPRRRRSASRSTPAAPPCATRIDAGPDLVKPNREELEELTGRTLATREALADAAAELAGGGVGTVVVSLGADGALFARNGAAVFASPPPVQVASTVGAGDAMVAGTIAGTLQGLPLEEVAALATAFSADAIARIGPHIDAAAVKRTAENVKVEGL